MCAIYICVSTHLIHYSYEVGAIIFPLPTKEEVGADYLEKLARARYINSEASQDSNPGNLAQKSMLFTLHRGSDLSPATSQV